MKRALLFVFGLLAAHAVFAQQDAEYSMYRFNQLYINPAYAGSHEMMSQTVIYRHQWIKIPGQPQTASASVHTPLRNDRLAVGIIYNYDRIGVTRTNSVNGSFAYRIPVGKKKNIRVCVGVSAGVMNYQGAYDRVKIIDENDPNFAGNNVNRWLPDFGMGVYAYSNRFFAGFSVPHMLANSLDGGNSIFVNSSDVAHRYYHLLFTGGYTFDIGKKVKLTPSALVKLVPVHAPVSFDVNINFTFIDRVHLGAGYRLNDCYNFMLAVNATKTWKIGYAYDLSVSSLRKFTSGSHEIMMSFDFEIWKKKQVVLTPADDRAPVTPPAEQPGGQ